MGISGNLSSLDFTELLQLLAQGRKTGTLVLARGEVEKRIYFDGGQIIASASNDAREHLRRFLVSGGLATDAQVDQALELQEASQMLLGKILVVKGVLSETDLDRVLRQKAQESIMEIFGWRAGDFHFVDGELPRLAMVPAALDVTALILEGLHRLDESGGVLVTEGETGVGDLLGLENNASAEAGAVAAGRVYGGESKGKGRRMALIGGGVALAVLAIAWVYWFGFRKPENPDGNAGLGPQENQASTAAGLGAAELETPVLELDAEPSEGPSDADVAQEELDELLALQASEIEGSLRAEYTDRLAALERQLIDARRSAAQRPAEPRSSAVSSPGTERAAEDRVQRVPGGVIGRVDSPSPTTLVATAAAGGDRGDRTVGSVQTGSPVQPPPATDSTRQPTVLPAQAKEDIARLPAPAGSEAGESDEAGAGLPPQQPPIEPPPPQVQRGDLVLAGPGVTRPKLVRRTSPSYPSMARRLRKEATVKVRILVDENGRSSQVELAGRKAGFGLDHAALSAARETAWQAATKNGVQVKMWVELAYNFRTE